MVVFKFLYSLMPFYMTSRVSMAEETYMQKWFCNMQMKNSFFKDKYSFSQKYKNNFNQAIKFVFFLVVPYLNYGLLW